MNAVKVQVVSHLHRRHLCLIGLRVQHSSQVCPMEQPRKAWMLGASALDHTVSPLLEIHSINQLIKDFEKP